MTGVAGSQRQESQGRDLREQKIYLAMVYSKLRRKGRRVSFMLEEAGHKKYGFYILGVRSILILKHRCLKMHDAALNREKCRAGVLSIMFGNIFIFSPQSILINVEIQQHTEKRHINK